MRSWYDTDSLGREFLTRSGTGTVADIAPVGIVDPGGLDTCFRIELHCETHAGRSGLLHFKTFPIAHADHPALVIARDAWSSGAALEWTAEWHRWPWIAADRPMSGLNLVTDAQPRLIRLDYLFEVPEFVPSNWTLDA